MPSPDTVPFTLSESDAHMAHQNTQQVIESIMQAISHLLKKLTKEEEKAPPDKEKAPLVDEEKVISLPELAELPVIEPVNIQQQTLQLDGADPNLLSAAPPYQLEGQGQQALLPGTSAEQIKPLLVAIRIEVEESAVVGSVLGEDGSDLREALAQLSPEQLEQVREAVERSAQADDVIDVESKTVRIDGWIEDEGQVEYLSLVGREQEAERTPLNSAAQESLKNSLETAGYDSYEALYQNEIEIEPDLQEQAEIVPPWEEKLEPIHTEQLSVEQVESWTGNDFSNSPHLDDVGTVIAQVDDQGRILDKGYVQQQVESRVEEAEAEDEEDAEVEGEIDEQRSAEIEEPSLESLPTAADYQAAETCQALLETIGFDRFEGDRYLIEQKGGVTSVTALDGRGLLLQMEGENILESHLEPRDIAQLQQGNEVLAQYAANKEQAEIAPPIPEPPSLDLALEPIAAGFELD